MRITIFPTRHKLDLVITNNNYVICDIVKTNHLEYNKNAIDHDSLTHLTILYNNNNNSDNNHIHFNYTKANMINLQIALFNINREEMRNRYS